MKTKYEFVQEDVDIMKDALEWAIDSAEEYSNWSAKDAFEELLAKIEKMEDENNNNKH